MRSIFLAFLLLVSSTILAQLFPIGTRNIDFFDQARNRTIGTVVHYPALVAGNDAEVADGGFPVLVFGHGFLMGVTSYNNFRDHFVPRGYILVLPTTESGFPDHGAFGEDLAFLSDALQAAGTDPGSPFHDHISPNTALMGHSMGGGASVLGAAGNSSIRTLVNFAAAETTPSAIDAAASVTAPTLIFAASADCVTPIAQHQQPIHDAIAADCKALVNITGGGHCYFANNDGICDLGELSCASSFTIDRVMQHDVVNDIAGLWLDAFLKDDGPSFAGFLDSLGTSDRFSGTTTCLTTAMDDHRSRSIRIFPNPSGDIIYFEDIAEGELIISGSDGRQISIHRIDGDRIELDVSSYPPGHYSMHLRSARGLIRKPFVVMH